MALKLTDFKTPIHNDWCTGYRDFGILSSLQKAITDMKLEQQNVDIFSGYAADYRGKQN